ncbi:hypothetical protein TRFO_09672 [Tritrichomonas foetus]|uniref:Protein kinase domain-containing protein n=1 Tax=Tritrichomonas foetus TaxID=1144522 RepID=A0A1J4JFP2_9EUKA|nr:hypothetical protein TRFO_09672 [Tritrichomonas foetus]|eukprot:OHS97103.1 hypothetical protein TRFO_09672 [Tritrichomonas foetus]
MSNFNRGFSSRHDNICKSIRITIINIVGITTPEPHQYFIKIHFPREEIDYTSPRIKSCGPLNFKYSVRFVPDDLLRNDLSLIFFDRLKLTLFQCSGSRKKYIASFPINLSLLINKKQVTFLKKSLSTKVGKVLTAKIECKWEASFDRNSRRNTNLRIFNMSDFETIQTISNTKSTTFQIVKQKKNDKIFAMKILNHNDRLAALSQGTDHESDALVTFNHPSILHIVGFIPRRFINRQQSAIVMDYIPNDTLQSILDTKHPHPGWCPTSKSKVLYGIAYGLQLLHTNGLMHNDLTPESILIDENFEPLIGDMGLARKETKDLEVKDLVYKAPEILFGKPYSYSADVYSFGMLLYHIVTGCSPYLGYTAPELMNAVIHGIKPQLPYDTPRNFVELIDICLAYDPLLRPNLEELVKMSNIFMFPGTKIDTFEDYCDKMNGKSNRKEKHKSLERIEIAAKQGIAYSQFLFALLMKKERVEMDFFKLSADQGIPEAQYDYGVMLAEGIGVAKNRCEAALYFKKSADKGNAKAALNIGMMLAEGKSVIRNDREAIQYFMESATQGNPKAQVNLGLMWMTGRGVRRNEGEAYKYYKMAADQGDPQAMYNLAILMSKGRSGIRNDSIAVRYFKKAADLGIVKAMFSMGLALLEGKGITQNDGEASHYFKIAADCGMPPAQLNISILLSKGQGIAKDELSSLNYIKNAADAGESEAQNLLGMMLLNGKCVKRNLLSAAKYLGDSAAGGCTKAMVNIGMMFLKGKGVKQNDKTAFKCFKVAAAKGNENAKRNIQMMVKSGRVKCP